MGMRIRCQLCNKMVRDKPLIGTTHFCLSPVDRVHRRWHLRQGRWMIEQQRQMMAVPADERGLGYLARLPAPTPSRSPEQPE